MPKQLVFSDEARVALREGVQKAGKAVRATLGPRGRAVVIDRSWGAPQVTYDGSTVTDEIDLQNPYENMGARLVKEAASKTNDDAGDGTTTAAVLAEAIFLGCHKLIVTGANPMGLSRGIRRAAEAVSGEIQKRTESLTVKQDKKLTQVATIAAKGDAEVGSLLSDAFRKIGPDGALAVEEGKGVETEVKIVEGMRFDRGFLSPHFVTNAESVESVLENPLILIHEDKLSSAHKLIPLLEKVAAQKRPLLVIAEDVEGEALATLVVNKLRGVLSCCAVKAPGYGDRRKAMLEDIAVSTGTRALYKDLGIDLEKAGIEVLGQAKKVIIDNDNTTLLQGAGRTQDIEARCAQIRHEIEESDSDYDREKLQERLSRLAGGVAQVLVGAATEAEMKQKKQRIESAVEAVRSALKDGVVPGGGVTLLRAGEVLSSLKGNQEEELGFGIVRRALSAPLREIVRNAGFEPSLVERQVREAKEGWGFDVVQGEMTDFRQAGILDATKVVRLALLNAASVAAMLTTAECLVSDIPEEQEKKFDH